MKIGEKCAYRAGEGYKLIKCSQNIIRNRITKKDENNLVKYWIKADKNAERQECPSSV